MEKETIGKIMYDSFLKSVPTVVVDTKNPISAYGSIDVDDLKSAIDRFDKVPDYGELLRENKKQKEIIDKTINYLKKWGKEPDADMHLQMKEYREYTELLDILKEVK